MADFFKFGGFLKTTQKKREDEAGLNDKPQPKASEESQPSMTQSDFSYGPEGMRRVKPKK